MARGLLDRVAKEEKIRGLHAEGEDNRREAEKGRRQRTATGNILKVDKASGRERERKKENERMKRLAKGERVACQEMRTIRRSAITLRAGVMPREGTKEKED